ncbi:MAG: hypothetical protein IJY20_01565 [Clostridia bacterium]|nr:hypothetical protein [Clostridia bacterium]
MNTKQKKGRFARILYVGVLFSFLIPIGILIFLIATYDPAHATLLRSDYVLMLVECVLGATVIHLPALLRHRWQVDIPMPLYIMFLVFLFCAITLGEIGFFYHLIPHYDDILHLMSSIMTGFFGYMLIALLNPQAKEKMPLSQFFVAIFAFCFSLTIGTVWEIYEFAADSILGLNMQRFRTLLGEPLIGQAALQDTMKDLIVDGCGALIATLIGALSMSRQRGWVHAYLQDTVDFSPNDDTAQNNIS